MTHPYGERRYTAIDPNGNAWTFSQSAADVDPQSWGWGDRGAQLRQEIEMYFLFGAKGT